MKKPSIQITYAWNWTVWPAGGTERAFLLVELKGESGGGECDGTLERDGGRRMAARSVQLTIRPLGSGGSLKKVYGYSSQFTEQGIRVTLGDLAHQETKPLLLEFALAPHAPGTHPLVHLRWEYIDPARGAKLCTEEQCVEAAFTNDPNQLWNAIHPNVEKQVNVMEMERTVELANQLIDSGHAEAGRQLLKRQADQLLRAAILLEDAELRGKAQTLYNQWEQLENKSWNS